MKNGKIWFRISRAYDFYVLSKYGSLNTVGVMLLMSVEYISIISSGTKHVKSVLYLAWLTSYKADQSDLRCTFQRKLPC